MKIQFQILGEDLMSRELARVGARAGDLSPAFHTIGALWVDWNAQLFGSEGSSGGHGTWHPLAESTLRSKRSQGFPEDILVATGRLRDELTTTANIEVHADWMGMVLPDEQNKYGRYQMSGTAHMPKRMPVDWTESNKREMVKVIQRQLFGGAV